MSQIGQVYQTETNVQTHTGNLTYTTKFTVLGSAFAANTEYILLLMAQVKGDIFNGRFKFRTQIGGSTPEGAEMIMEPSGDAGPDFSPYVFLHKFTTAGTPDAVTFQIAPQQNTVDTATADTIVFIALSLDDLASSDWEYGEDLTDINHTTGSTFQDQASITFTPGTTGEDWLVIAWGSVHINNTGKQWRYRINQDSGTSLEPTLSQEGEDNAEEIPWMLVRPFNLDNSGHTFTVQSNDDTTAGAENQHNISKIFALRMQAFENSKVFFDGGTFNTPDTVFNEIVDLAFTPDTTGNVLVIGTAMCDVDQATRLGSLRCQLAGTTVPTGSDSQVSISSYDPDDLNSMPVLVRISVTGGVLSDIDIDAKVNNVASDIVDRGFVAFSLELAAAAPTDDQEMDFSFGVFRSLEVRGIGTYGF